MRMRYWDKTIDSELRYFDMNLFGYPHLIIFEDGQIYNTETNKYLDIKNLDTKKCGMYLSGSNKHDIKGKYVKGSPIWGFYFDSPWSEEIEYKNLSFINFSSYWITIDGRLWGSWKGKYIKFSNDKDGYSVTGLIDDNGIKWGCCRAHRLVAMAFIPNPNNLPLVNHIDGDKQNNHKNNLEWIDAFGNSLHARNIGLVKSAMTDKQIHEICNMLETDERRIDISNKVGIPYDNVRIIERGGWRHISDKYNFKRRK